MEFTILLGVIFFIAVATSAKIIKLFIEDQKENNNDERKTNRRL